MSIHTAFDGFLLLNVALKITSREMRFDKILKTSLFLLQETQMQ